MRAPIMGCCIISMLLSGCIPNWKRSEGSITLSQPYFSHPMNAVISPALEQKPSSGSVPPPPRRLSFSVPADWYWVMVGNDLMATRDGVFLQNLSIERIHVDQTEPSNGMFPLAALSSKQWPVRTLKVLKKRFMRDMVPAEVVEVVLANWASNPSLFDLQVREVSYETLAGHPSFKAVCDFTLDILGRKVSYRSVYRGIMPDDWFYGFAYSAARRYYFERDASSFEKFLQTVRLTEK